MRPRVHRAHQGPEEPRRHPARAVDPREPHAPRRHGRRSAAGGRRRHPDPGSRHLPAPRVRQARDHAAGHRTVRRRHGVPAAGARVPHGVRAGNRARDRRRGTGAARLARRAGEQRGAVGAHEGGRTRHPADLRRPRQPRPRPGRPRAQAVRDPQARGPRDPVAAPAARQGVLRPVAVHADDHLQGHAARAPGRRVLLGPRGHVDGVGARDGPPAVLDQHLSDVGPGAPVPLRLPQRRDQHAARQLQLDARPRGRDRLGGAGRRPAEAVAADLRRPVRLRVVRQRARAAGDGRLSAAARDDDDDSRGVGRESADGRGPARVLRVPRGADGAVGRARRDGVHERAADRRDARSQRPASGALRRHRRRLHRDGVRGRRPRHPGVEDRQEVAAAARQDAARRHRAGAHRRRRRAEAHARDGKAVSRMDRRVPDAPRGDARARARRGVRGPAARPPAGVRLHAGGREDPADADGRERRGGAGLDGQRRRAAGPLRSAEGLLQLLQAAVRAGHEPADRPDPRGARDVARVVHRAAAEPARHRRHGAADAARGAAADPDAGQHGEDPARRALLRRRVPLDRARHLLSGGMGRQRHGSGAGEPRRARGRRDPAGLQHPDPVRPDGGPRRAADSGAARDGGRARAPGQDRAAHVGGTRRRNGLGARGAPLRAARGLRRRGDPPVPRARDARGTLGDDSRDRRQGVGQALHQGDLQGPEQGDVQDGHLHVPVVLRRADLRGGRAAAGVRRQVLHRHREQRRGHRPVRGRRGVGAAAPDRVRRRSAAARHARPGRRVPVPDPRRSAHVDAGVDREAAARGAVEQRRHVSRLREAHQRPEPRAEDAARTVRVPERRPRARPARRSRAGGVDRAPVRDGRDEPGLDLHRSAHDARRRDEPHRRQVEHRRGRRGRGALPQRTAHRQERRRGRRHAGVGDRPRPRRARLSRCSPATACARRSSRSPPAASA